MKKLITTLALLAGAYTVPAQCVYFPSTTTATDSLTYTLVGGTTGSFGCAPIDPTYWLSGGGDTVTATFVTLQNYPAFRVWGMNQDDSASVYVNGVLVHMDSTVAYADTLVSCGISGPDGIRFANGKINGPATGNYSYQDIHLYATAVNKIMVVGLTGAGWGFAGFSLHCPVTYAPLGLSAARAGSAISVYPSPASGTATLYIPDGISVDRVVICNPVGQQVKTIESTLTGRVQLPLAGLPSGLYLLHLTGPNGLNTTRRIEVRN